MDERANLLVVTGGKADMDRIASLVEQLDTSQVTNVMEVRVYPLLNADATELATLLKDTLTAKPLAPTAGSANRQALLQFIGKDAGGKEKVASALQQGLLITPDKRSNALVVAAPQDFLPLLTEMIAALDTIQAPAGEIRTFVLQNADATQMATLLGELFRMKAGTAATGQTIQYTMTTTQPAGGADDSASAVIGAKQQEALTVTVDTRTNTLLIGGTAQYVELASKVIKELDSSPGQERLSAVYRLRNADATDVETAMQTWRDQERQRMMQTLGANNIGSAARMLEQEISVVAEKTSNMLLISASPRYFATVQQMIEEMDEPPPQVLIQVLLAEVTLDNSNELGVDWNLLTKAAPNATLNTGTNFGEKTNIGGSGFSFSVTGGDLSMFLRALQGQGRLEVLSRPQVLASDNQQATVNVGQQVPFVSNSRVSDTGAVFNTIEYQDVGISLDVTPTINPDGFVKMKIHPAIKSVSTSSVQISENVNAVIINNRETQTTVTVQDGHTIVIGGLITTRDENREDKVPLLGDIPWLGTLFKKSTVTKERTELLIIMTPQVIRTIPDADKLTNRQLKRLNMMRPISTDIDLGNLFNPLQTIGPASGQKTSGMRILRAGLRRQPAGPGAGGHHGYAAGRHGSRRRPGPRQPAGRRRRLADRRRSEGHLPGRAGRPPVGRGPAAVRRHGQPGRPDRSAECRQSARCAGLAVAPRGTLRAARRRNDTKVAVE